MPTCSFCKKNYAEHKGLTVFTFDGRSVHFCSSKCRRNADLGRDAKKVNWIKREKKVGEARKRKVVVKEEKRVERKIDEDKKVAKKERVKEVKKEVDEDDE